MGGDAPPVSPAGPSNPRVSLRRERRPSAGDRSLGALLVLLGLVTVALVSRPWWGDPARGGVLIEVSGEVPRPGFYRLQEATVQAAVAAAGGTEILGEGTVPMGYQVRVEEGVARVLLPSDPLLVALPIDLNQCEATALEAIPGVGTSLADAIVADRMSNGPFYGVDDLLRVRGVGPAGLETIVPFVTVGDVGPRPPRRPLDLNQVTADELERLPGIGPVTAARIIVDREDNGPYGSVDALQRVKGVGPKTVERLRDRVRVP